MTRGVKRIVVLQPGAGTGPRVVFSGDQRRRKRKRQSNDSGWFETLTRNTARAIETGAQSYVDRHQRSNRRRRDGWLIDFPSNVWAATAVAKRRFTSWKIW
jgi:hypothetical protein